MMTFTQLLLCAAALSIPRILTGKLNIYLDAAIVVLSYLTPAASSKGKAVQPLLTSALIAAHLSVPLRSIPLSLLAVNLLPSPGAFGAQTATAFGSSAVLRFVHLLPVPATNWGKAIVFLFSLSRLWEVASSIAVMRAMWPVPPEQRGVYFRSIILLSSVLAVEGVKALKRVVRQTPLSVQREALKQRLESGKFENLKAHGGQLSENPGAEPSSDEKEIGGKAAAEFRSSGKFSSQNEDESTHKSRSSDEADLKEDLPPTAEEMESEFDMLDPEDTQESDTFPSFTPRKPNPSASTSLLATPAPPSSRASIPVVPSPFVSRDKIPRTPAVVRRSNLK